VDASFEISDQNGRWRVTLEGDFSEEKANVLAETVKEKLSGGAPKEVFVDLRGLEGFSIFARSIMVQVQTAWREVGARTAYLSSRPRFRGLGLWICHLAEDDCAGSFIAENAVEDWLKSTLRREDDAQAKLTGGRR